MEPWKTIQLKFRLATEKEGSQIEEVVEVEVPDNVEKAIAEIQEAYSLWMLEKWSCDLSLGS